MWSCSISVDYWQDSVGSWGGERSPAEMECGAAPPLLAFILPPLSMVCPTATNESVVISTKQPLLQNRNLSQREESASTPRL